MIATVVSFKSLVPTHSATEDSRSGSAGGSGGVDGAGGYGGSGDYGGGAGGGASGTTDMWTS